MSPWSLCPSCNLMATKGEVCNRCRWLKAIGEYVDLAAMVDVGVVDVLVDALDAVADILREHALQRARIFGAMTASQRDATLNELRRQADAMAGAKQRDLLEA